MYLTRAFIFIALLYAGLTNVAYSHLLNMSKASLTHNNEKLELTLTVDLTRALGSSERYFSLSRVTPSFAPGTQDADVKLLLAALIAGLDIRVGKHPVDWTVSQLILPSDTPRDDFFSGLAWPMTTVKLEAIIPQISHDIDKTLTARFSSTFAFEEPIALTINQPSTRRSLSRWLVRNQQSPAFSLTAQDAQSTYKSTDKNTDKIANSDTSITLAIEYLWQGIIHILPKGWDHVLFVLGMFLGVRQLKHLLLWVTGFTLAHTVTLGLAAFGAIEISSAIVEPIIVISIAWVAIENIVLRPSVRWRFTLVTLFGLVHGLGFASVVKTLPMPTDNFTLALVSFNIGVELAQLAVLVVAFMLVGYWWKKPYWHTRVVVPGSAIIAGLASILFIQMIA